MNEKFLKPYNPKEVEENIYKIWEESGYFNPDNCLKNKLTNRKNGYFSIVLPPPNVTGHLHMGHAATITIEDIMVRFNRMKGKDTLWIPGTDHAAIATQSKIEKIIQKEEGLNRYDLGREELMKRVEKFAQDSHDTIVNQVKRMGASVDWSREAFTLDENRNLAVRTTFKKMYDDGLIYRGHRIVNWDPKGQTTISDDEIVYKEEKTKFYYFKYGPFTIGTARPETKFGDKYVVMHPADDRYKEYKHGQKLTVEWINGPIESIVIKDESIDMEFGTGVMTITPWHSVVDFEIAERHKLDKEQIIDKYGKLLPIAGEFAGFKIADAREKIVEKLKSKGLLTKEEDYVHNIATAERTGGAIEPQIMNQWFIDVNKKFKIKKSKIKGIDDGKEVNLKELMSQVVKNSQVKIIPERFEKIYFNWIDNLRDWCISRQIWYGHRIPVWYKQEKIYCDINPPKGDGWEQDQDTLDTWFSSGLWTFSTLGWPKDTEDMKKYHPTSVLETGYDILFFWIARMILMSVYLLGEIPFETVYLHGLVRDEKGMKMSKSLGNIIDPIDMVEKFGSDAVRMSLIIGTGPGNDSKMSESKIKAYKHFANKIWNASRFVIENTRDIGDLGRIELIEKDREYIEEFNAVNKEVTEMLENFKFYLAGEKIYHYFWHKFADIIIEEVKTRIKNSEEKEKNSGKKTLLLILKNSLKIIHPFMPFITEEIWISFFKTDRYLMTENWPEEINNKNGDC